MTAQRFDDVAADLSATEDGPRAPETDTGMNAGPPVGDRRGAALASLAKTARVFLFVLIAAAVLWLLADLVLLIFAAALIAVALRGVSDALSRHAKLPVFLALPLVVIALFGMIFLLGFWLGPRFADEFRQLGGTLGGALTSAETRFGNTIWGQVLLGLKQEVTSRHAILLGTSVLTGTLGGVGSVLVVIVTGLYLAATPRLYLDGAMLLVPASRRERAREIALEVGHVLRWWMLGQLVNMVAVGALASVGLSLLNLPMALALGVLAGLLTFIPYLGAFIAAVPGIVVALTVNLPTVLWVIVVYLCCHGVEGYLISPLINRRTVHLPPALTVLSMAVLGSIYGAFGVVIGTPIAAAGLVLCREIYIADTLGETLSRHALPRRDAGRAPGA